MESLYVNPIVEDIDSAGKVWAALADDSAVTVKNLTSVANVLDKIAKNTQTTFEEVTNGVKDLSDTQRRVLQGTLKMVQNVSSGVASKLLNELSQGLSGVVNKAQQVKASNNTTYAVTNVAVQRALRSTIIPALRKEISNLTESEFGRLAEALGDQGRSSKTNAQNRVAVGYRSLMGQLKTNKAYQKLINQDQEAKKLFDQMITAVNNMRADEISEGRGSAIVNRAFEQFIKYAKGQGAVKPSSTSASALGGKWGHQAGKALGQNVVAIKQSANVDTFLKNTFGKDKTVAQQAEYKSIKEQLKATTDSLKQQGIPYELRRKGKEVQVVMFDPNTYRFSGGKVDEKQSANMTFAIGGYNTRASHLVPYNGRLMPANVVQARLNTELVSGQKMSTVASMKRKISDINEATSYKAVNKYENVVDNPKTTKDRALREGTVRYDNFQQGLINLEKSLRPDAYEKTVQEGIETLIQYTMGRTIKEAEAGLKAIQARYNLSDTVVQKFKQEGEWLKDVTWMSEEDRGHQRAYLRSAVKEKMYLPTRKIQNRDIMSYADGIEDRLVQTIQIDLDRMFSHIEKDGGLSHQDKARYKALLEGMGKDALVMAENQIEQLNSIRENVSVKISEKELAQLKKEGKVKTNEDVYRYLLGREGRTAQGGHTVSFSKENGMITLTGNEFIRAQAGTKINSEGFNLRHVIQSADEDFVKYILGALGIEADKNARAVTISKLNTEVSGRNLGPFVTGIINDALTNFKDQSDEEIKKKLKSSYSGREGSNAVVGAAMEVLKTPYDLERILDQATGEKATSGEQGKFLSKILYTIATAAGHKQFELNRNGELSTGALGLSFLDKVGIRESEYAAKGDTSLPTNFEFDDFYRSASRAGFDFKKISKSQLAHWTMMGIGATAQDIKEREEAQERYKEHMKRQQQLEESYDPEYLNKMLGDENLIVVGDREMYKDKIGASHLIDVMGLQSSHRGEDGMIDNREATIWGKLEDVLKGKSAEDLSKMRIVVDLGDNMGKLRFMDMAANIGEYGSYNNKLESLLMEVSGGQSAFTKSELLTDALKSEIYAFENTGGALNANFLAKAQENSENRRRAIQKALRESGELAQGEQLLGRNFYGENLNVTKLSGDKNEIESLSDIIEHSGGYVSTARAKAWAAEGLYREGAQNWGDELVNFLQKLGAVADDARWKDITKDVTSFGQAVNFVAEALTTGTERHTALYGGDNPLLKYGMGYVLGRNPYSQMVNAQFGNYLFAKEGLSDNVVESNRGLNSLVMGDFDGDKLLAVLMDLEQVAKDDIATREKQTGQEDKTGKEQLKELHEAIQKVYEFNAFNYRVMSANLKTVTGSDAQSSVLYEGNKAGITTEEQRDIILQYQNRSKGQTGYLSNLAKGGRNLLENLGYGLNALLGSDSKTLVKYGQGAVVFQVLEQLEQDAISAKKLWDDALEQIKAVEGKTDEDLRKLTSSERTKLLSKYLDDQMASIVNKAYSGDMDLLDLFNKTKNLGVFKNDQLEQRRSLEILTPIANKENAREILGQLFKNSKGTLNEIAKNLGYNDWKSANDKNVEDKDFAKKFRAGLSGGGFSDWALSMEAMRSIISDFNADNKDFLAQSRLYSGRFQEEFGPSSLLANNNMSVAAAVLKKVESLRTGLKDEGGSGGVGGGGDGTKDIVSILTEIRDLLAKQGRGDLNEKFGKSYLSPTGIAHTIISSPFEESNMDMMRQVLATNLKEPLPKWTDEERATAFGFFGNVSEFEKQREYMLGSLRGTLTHAVQEKGKLKQKSPEMSEFNKQMKLLGFDEGRIELERKEAFRAAKVTAKLEQSMFGKEGKLGSEIGFSYNTGNGKQIGGKIDALYIGEDGRVYVGDYKTGKRLGAEEAVQAQMYQEIIRQALGDFRQMKYGNEGQDTAIGKIKEKYGFSDDANNFLEQVWERDAFSAGRQAYLMHYNEGVGRLVSVNTPADDILAKIFNNEALSKEEIEYEKNALQVQTGRTVSDKTGFLKDYRDYYGQAYGTDAYVNASKGVVEKETEEEALGEKLIEIEKQYGVDSPVYKKLSDYYENLKSETEALSQLREKVAEEYEWTEKDKELGGQKAKDSFSSPKRETYKYNKILKEDAVEREKNYKAVEAQNKRIAAAEKKMLMYDKQSRTTVGQVGSYKESTQTLIEHQKEEINLLIEKRKELLANSNLTQAETESLNQQLTTMRMVNKEEVKRSNKGANNWLDIISSGIKNTVTRMFDFNGVYRVINKLSQGLQRVLDLTNQLDQATFNVQVVTGQSRGEVSGLITSYRELADQLGATTIQIANAANEWLRQGYEAQQANELITASTYLSKLGMIESGQATEYLTSMIKGFKLEVSDAIDVVSKLTAVDMEAASSAGDIAAALQNVSTTAQLAGVSLDETIAYATTIIETTQRDASSVGMALRTIMSRYGNVKAGAYTKMNLEYSSDTDFENLNDIEKVLGKIGIRIRSTNTEFRSFSDVLEELSDKWINLDSVSKNAIATAMAGVRQREQFLVLMENMDRVEELEQVSATSQGTAEQKYAAYMETIESARNRLSNAWSEMAQRLEESGVVKAFTDVAVFITQNLLPALNAFASALIAYNGFKIPTLIGNAGKKLVDSMPRITGGRDAMYQRMVDWQDQNKLEKDPITGKYYTKKSGFLEQYVDKQLGDDFVQGSNSLTKFSATVDKATGSVEKLAEKNQEGVEESKNLEKNQDKQSKISSKSNLEELTKRRDTAKANLEQAEAAEKAAKANLEHAQAVEADKKQALLYARLEENFAKEKTEMVAQELDERGKKLLADNRSIQSENQKIEANRQSAQSEYQDAQANLKDAQTEYTNAQANLKDAQTELQGAQGGLSSGLKGAASSSTAGAIAGIGLSALTSGVTTGMSTEGSTEAKAVSGTVSGVATAGLGGIGFAVGGPLGAAIGSSLGSMLGSIFGPMLAEAIDKEENDRKKRIEDATKLLDTLKSQESALEAITAMSKQESLLSNDIKAIRQYVQDIKNSNKEDSTGRRTFEELLNNEAAEAKQQGSQSLIERLGAGTAQRAYDNLELYLTNDSTEEAREVRKELTLFLKQANVRAQKNAFLGSKEGKTLSSSDKRELLQYEIQEAYLASGVSNQSSSELTKKGIKAAYQEVVDAVNKNRAPEDQLLLTSDVQKMIHLLMEEDGSTSVQSLLVGGNYTLSDIVHNTYKLSEEVQNDLLTQAALALGLSVDDVKKRVDEFGLLTVGDLNSSVSDLSDALSSLTSYFDEVMSTGALSLNSLKEIISANGDMATSLGEKDFSYLFDVIPQDFAEIGRKSLENWSQGSASGAGIYEKLAGSDDTNIRAAFQILEQEGFTEDKSSLNNLYNALKSNKFGQSAEAAAGAEEIWDMYFENYLQASENIDNVIAAEYEKTTQSAQDAIDRSLQRQQNALEEQKSALEDINSQREYENKLIEAKIKLENAQNEKKKVWREGVGWVYEADTSAIADAQKELDELDNEKKVNELQVMIDELQAQRDWMSNLTESKEFEKAQKFMKQWANNADSTMAVLKFWENAVDNPPSFNITDKEQLKANKLAAATYKDSLKLDSLKQAYTDLLNTQGGKLLLNGGTQAQLGQMDESDIQAFNTAVEDFQTAYTAAADQHALTNDNAITHSGLTSEDIKKFNSMQEDTKSAGYITSGIGTVQNIGKSNDWGTKLTVEEGESDFERFGILLSLMNGASNYMMKGHEAGSLTPTTNEANENEDGRWNTTWRKDLQVLDDGGTWFRPGDALGESTANIKQKYSKHFLYNQATGKYYYIGANGIVYDAKFTPSHAIGTLSAPGGLSMVNDDAQYGLEGIITPQGTLTALPSKSGVVPADMTRNVWQLGEVAPNLIKQLVDINGKFNSPTSFGTDESFNVDHLDVHMVAQPGFDMDDFVRQLQAARNLTRHS